MKLYTFALAPNSKKVSIFLRIKKKSISTFELNVRDGEQFKEPFNTMNPFNCVPFLEFLPATSRRRRVRSTGFCTPPLVRPAWQCQRCSRSGALGSQAPTRHSFRLVSESFGCTRPWWR